MEQSPQASSVLLVGEKVTLREFDLKDFDAVHAYARDLESWTYVEWHANSPQETREYLARAVNGRRADPRSDYSLAITTTGSEQVVGAVELRIDVADRERASLGYIVNRVHQSHGYATEATILILDFGLGSLGAATYRSDV